MLLEFLSLIALTLAVGVGVMMGLAWHHDSRDAKEIAGLLTLPPPARLRDPASLPKPLDFFVARAVVGAPGIPAWIQLSQQAEMRFKPGSEWVPMRAEQFTALTEPGFIWMTRAVAMRVLSLKVIDSYIKGKARVEGRLFGAIGLFKLEKDAIDEGELLRYLAELAWAPGAFLCNESLDFAPLGDGRVAVSCGPAIVELHFDAEGDLVEIHAPSRPRVMGGKTINTPWRGRFSDYQDFNGFRLPRRSEAAWILEDGPFIYFRADILGLTQGPLAA